MSFIYENNELIQALIKAGQLQVAREPEQPKLDISAPEVRKSIPNYEMAYQLLSNLQKELGGQPSTDMPIGIEGDTAANAVSAKIANFRTLGDFLIWAADNKLTWKGKRFSWLNDADFNQKPPADALPFTAYSYNRDDRAIDRQPETSEVYADKNSLIEYLSALRDSPDTKKDKLLPFMISTLIGEVNKNFMAVDEKPLSTHSIKTPQDELNPNIVIDLVPNIFTSDNKFEGLNKMPFKTIDSDDANALTVGDLLNQRAFFSWLKNRKIMATKSGPAGQPGTTFQVGALDPGRDHSFAINFLLERAKYLKGIAPAHEDVVPGFEKAAALYFQAVTAYGQQLTGVSSGTTDKTTPTAGTKQDTGRTTKGVQLFNNIILKMPLTLDAINLVNIEDFFNAYEEFESDNETIASYHAEFSKAREYFKNTLRVPTTSVIQLNRSLSDFIPIIASPTKYSNFVQNLIVMITAANMAVSMFNARYNRESDNKDQDTPELTAVQRRKVSGQDSIFNANMRVLNGWLDHAKQLFKIRK